MSYTITITDPTPDETRKLISMLQASIGTSAMTSKGTPVDFEFQEIGHVVGRIGSEPEIRREPATPVVPPSVAEWVGREIDRLAAEQKRDLRVRYFYHPESDSYFMLQPGEVLGFDADSQLCHEITEEEYRANRPEPTLSELSAAIQHDPSVFAASPQLSAGAPSSAAVAPAPTAPEVPPASLIVPPAPPAPAPAPAAPEVAPPAPAAPSAVALDADGLPWDARIHSSSKEKVKAGTWKYRRGVDDADIAKVEAELRQLMAIPAPAPAAVATPAPPPPPAAALPVVQAMNAITPLIASKRADTPAPPPPPAAALPVVQAMNAITPLIASKRADTPVILAKLAEMGLKSPSDFNARPDLLPEFLQWTATL